MEEKLFFKIKLALIFTVIIGYSIHIIIKYTKKTPKDTFPIIIAKCPDYWEIVGKNKCKNVNKIGTCNLEGDSIMDFSDDSYRSKDGNYFKCQWAKNCGVSWQGIDLQC